MKQLDQSKKWYSDFDKIKQSDAELQANLVKPSEVVKSLLA
jgi:hypothetical protein